MAVSRRGNSFTAIGVTWFVNHLALEKLKMWMCRQKRESSNRRMSVVEQSQQEVNDQRLNDYKHAVIRSLFDYA